MANRLQIWFAGAIFALCVVYLHEDWVGKEQYLRNVSDSWVDFPWALWLIPMVLNIFPIFFSPDKKVN